MRAVYWVFRRELHVMLRAPILYVVGGLFLVVQGVAFAGLVGALSDPRKPAPLGALLEGQLAGTLLTWVLALVVLTLLGMRAIADDKKSGLWELLLTAQVGEAAAVVGKWLAACVVYVLLWIPTLAYFALVAIYRADSGGWDVGAIVTGYVGAIAIGAALLAWAIAASAAMNSTLGAGALGFALLLGGFLVGELPSLWPDIAVDHPTAAALLDAISIRQRAIDFARGEVALGAVLFVIAIAVTGLSLAVALSCVGRRRGVPMRVLGTIAIGAVGIFATALAVRHPARLDVSAGRRNTLDPATVDVVAALPSQAKITVIRPTLGGLEPIYEEVTRVVERMGSRVTIRWIDPADVPGGIPAVAREAGMEENDLKSSGALLVELDKRRRVIDLFALAKVDAGPGGATTIERLSVERAVAGALAELSHAQPVTVCTTTGHGELPMAARVDKADWHIVAQRLEGEGMKLEDVAVTVEVPKRCTVLLVAGASSRFTPEEALAVQAYMKSGGALLVAAATRTLDTGQPLGLEAILENDGIALPAAFAIDPSLVVREIPGALFVVDGYVDHPINEGFAKTRATLWFQPRAVITAGDAKPLVRASDASWAELDLHASPPVKDGNDLPGPIALAALGKSQHVIVVGTAESLMDAVISRGGSALDLWLANAVRFLAGIQRPQIAARTPDQVRLVLTAGQRRAVIGLSVGAIPLAWMLIGGAIVLLRRRRK